jgi:YaaC-like Protein
VIAELRDKFPFIKRLNLTSAMFVYGDIRLEFDNASPGGAYPNTASELSADLSGTALYFPRKETSATIPLSEILPCAEGGIEGRFPTFSSALKEEVYLSEVVLHYLGLFLLGSLVRYRPEIWIHSLYGHHNPERPRDDSARALVERFLDVAAIQVPAWCGSAIRAPLLNG